MPAVALTDHGSLAGAGRAHKETQKQGVKPMIGCEVYVADDRNAQKKGYAHLTLLAETTRATRNLIKLSRSATSRATTTSRASTGSCSSARARA